MPYIPPPKHPLTEPSFFDRQHGDFDLVLYSIEAKKHDDLVRPWWRSIATFPAVFFSLLLVTIVFLEMP